MNRFGLADKNRTGSADLTVFFIQCEQTRTSFEQTERYEPTLKINQSLKDLVFDCESSQNVKNTEYVFKKANGLTFL